jgi:hypothetical protein
MQASENRDLTGSRSEILRKAPAEGPSTLMVRTQARRSTSDASPSRGARKRRSRGPIESR